MEQLDALMNLGEALYTACTGSKFNSLPESFDAVCLMSRCPQSRIESRTYTAVCGRRGTRQAMSCMNAEGYALHFSVIIMNRMLVCFRSLCHAWRVQHVQARKDMLGYDVTAPAYVPSLASARSGQPMS